MKDFLEYKGFYGNVEISLEDEVIHGKLLFINDLVTYESDDIPGIKGAFEEAVDDYIVFCQSHNREPDKPYKGSFNVRIDPSLHRALAIKAERSGITLNQLVSNALYRDIYSDDNSSTEHKVIREKLDNLGKSVNTMNTNFVNSTIANMCVSKIIELKES